ncbi:hypothetical protein CYMTET_20266 [Cymbomonas tetramitiformis]|uniref:HECT-type E3 ubiquitin transferase n=1 Tax=Cymbomonas tetramitiformis TaxID=36881 RepID=A0AAE0G4L0_9CHLO|nr:hypothetical protein CYMTET_20266 [Cymbomonas tetramitiformis]
MGFEASRKVKGGEDKAKLLEKVSAERAARENERQKSRAAQRIQRAFRGHITRHQVRISIREQWDAEFGADVAKGVQLTARVLYERLLPQTLFLVLPSSSVGKTALTVQLWEDHVVRLRGVAGLMLGSIGSTDRLLNYTALAMEGSEERQAAWQTQCLRLIRLCSCVLASSARATSSAPDQLLVTGFARLTARLLEGAQWKCFPAGDSGATAAARRLMHGLVQCPAAMRNLNRFMSSKPAAPSCAAPCAAGAAPKASAKSIVDLVQQVLCIVIDGLASLLQDPSSEVAAAALVLHTFTIPGLTKELPKHVVAHLQSRDVLGKCLKCVVDSDGSLARLHSIVDPSAEALPQSAGAEGALRALLEAVTDLTTGPVLQEQSVCRRYISALHLLVPGLLQDQTADDAQLDFLLGREHLEAILRGVQDDEVLLGEMLLLYRKLMCGGGRAKEGSMALRNTLAFHPALLGRWWGWVARGLRVPAEVPDQVADHAGDACWDMVTLRSGVYELPEGIAGVLALFCKARPCRTPTRAFHLRSLLPAAASEHLQRGSRRCLPCDSALLEGVVQIFHYAWTGSWLRPLTAVTVFPRGSTDGQVAASSL